MCAEQTAQTQRAAYGLPPFLAGSTLCRSLLCLLLCLLGLSACTTSSGLLGSGSWQPSSLQGRHIRTLAVDPNDPNTIYAGAAQGMLFVSTDAGVHWSARTAISATHALHVLTFDESGKRLYAATDQGLFVSSTAGQQWQLVEGAPQADYPALTFDRAAPHTIYAGTVQQGVWRSVDGGVTWTAAGKLPAGVAVNDLAYDSDRHRLWAATSAGVYRSDDQGTSWRALSEGLPAQSAVNTILPASLSGGAQDVLYAGTTQGFYRSQDAGLHWSLGHTPLVSTSVYVLLADFRSTNATSLYAGTDKGVLRSEDSGQSWNNVASGLPQGQAAYALALGANDYAQLFVAADTVYLYPGSGGGLSPSRLLPLLLVVAFFYGLLTFSRRRRRTMRTLPPRVPPPVPSE